MFYPKKILSASVCKNNCAMSAGKYQKHKSWQISRQISTFNTPDKVTARKNIEWLSVTGKK